MRHSRRIFASHHIAETYSDPLAPADPVLRLHLGRMDRPAPKGLGAAVAAKILAAAGLKPKGGDRGTQ